MPVQLCLPKPSADVHHKVFDSKIEDSFSPKPLKLKFSHIQNFDCPKLNARFCFTRWNVKKSPKSQKKSREAVTDNEKKTARRKKLYFGHVLKLLCELTKQYVNIWCITTYFYSHIWHEHTRVNELSKVKSSVFLVRVAKIAKKRENIFSSKLVSVLLASSGLKTKSFWELVELLS